MCSIYSQRHSNETGLIICKRAVVTVWCIDLPFKPGTKLAPPCWRKLDKLTYHVGRLQTRGLPHTHIKKYWTTSAAADVEKSWSCVQLRHVMWCAAHCLTLIAKHCKWPRLAPARRWSTRSTNGAPIRPLQSCGGGGINVW